MNRRDALAMFATALISVAALPDDCLSEANSLKDQLIGTWIYESSKAKREDGTAVERPKLQGAVTYTAEAASILSRCVPTLHADFGFRAHTGSACGAIEVETEPGLFTEFRIVLRRTNQG